MLDTVYIEPGYLKTNGSRTFVREFEILATPVTKELWDFVYRKADTRSLSFIHPLTTLEGFVHGISHIEANIFCDEATKVLRQDCRLPSETQLTYLYQISPESFEYNYPREYCADDWVETLPTQDLDGPFVCSNNFNRRISVFRPGLRGHQDKSAIGISPVFRMVNLDLINYEKSFMDFLACA
jgi:hypothetical protein